MLESRLAFRTSCSWPSCLMVKRLIVYGWFSYLFHRANVHVFFLCRLATLFAVSAQCRQWLVSFKQPHVSHVHHLSGWFQARMEVTCSVKLLQDHQQKKINNIAFSRQKDLSMSCSRVGCSYNSFLSQIRSRHAKLLHAIQLEHLCKCPSHWKSRIHRSKRSWTFPG